MREMQSNWMKERKTMYNTLEEREMCYEISRLQRSSLRLREKTTAKHTPRVLMLCHTSPTISFRNWLPAMAVEECPATGTLAYSL